MMVLLKTLSLSFALLLITTWQSVAHNEEYINTIVNTFKTSMYSGNAREMSELFDNTIELTYSNTHSTYSRGHAIMILNNFYAKNLPTSFSIDYTGITANKDAHYVIGTASTQNGRFRVYLYIKNKGGKFVIQELKIDK